jgi:hypothetical protein
MPPLTGELRAQVLEVLRGSPLAVLVRQVQGGVLSGMGVPAVAAPVGTLYRRLDGGAGSTLYVKESGGSTSAGWVAK